MRFFDVETKNYRYEVGKDTVPSLGGPPERVTEILWENSDKLVKVRFANSSDDGARSLLIPVAQVQRMRAREVETSQNGDFGARSSNADHPGFWISEETVQVIENLLEELEGVLPAELTHQYVERLAARRRDISTYLCAQPIPKP